MTATAASAGNGARRRHTVAVCLACGRFLLNESSLAEHYDVSRTVAHEVLTKLERTGIVTRDNNQRWYAGPLTPKNIREHFEIRRLLEPVAPRQAFPKLDPSDLRQKRDRVARAKSGRPPARKLERIEQDLHIHVIAQGDNALLLDTVRRSQLPLIATHSTFHRYHKPEEIEAMVADHVAILESLIAGRIEPAATMLESHIRRSLEPNIDIWMRLGGIPKGMLPDYMTGVGQR